jgi:uncharacterized protein (DUF1810 family)
MTRRRCPFRPSGSASRDAFRRKTQTLDLVCLSQLAGLGRSGTAQHYAIQDLAEACECLRDPVLGARYEEITAAVAEKLEAGVPVERLMGGSIDALKLASSLTLFSAATSRLADAASSDLARRCDAILEITTRQGYPACQFTMEQLSSADH